MSSYDDPIDVATFINKQHAPISRLPSSSSGMSASYPPVARVLYTFLTRARRILLVIHESIMKVSACFTRSSTRTRPNDEAELR